MSHHDVVAAFDPALNSPGAALFVNGLLRLTDNVKVPDALADLDMATRVNEVARLCVGWYTDAIIKVADEDRENSIVYADTLVIAYEMPTLRGGGPSKVDPDDVVHIAMVASAIAARLRPSCPTKIVAPTPEQWNHGSKKIKRNAPIIWEGQRGIQIASRLQPCERAIVPDKHDALDAVGIGLHALGRMEVRRVNARRRRAT